MMIFTKFELEGNFMETLDIARRTPTSRSELNVTDFDLILYKMFEAFQHWQKTCFEAAGGTTLTGQELFVLLAISHSGRLKTLDDVGRMLNRADLFNIKFCISKLSKLGLIEKVKQPKQKRLSYQLTSEGIKITSKFTTLRNKVVNDFLKNDPNLKFENSVLIIEKLKEIYDKASTIVINYK